MATLAYQLRDPLSQSHMHLPADSAPPSQLSHRARERDEVKCQVWINRVNTLYSRDMYVCVDET